MIKNDKLIYKVCNKSEWNDAKKLGKFYGSKKDILDGYIHFSPKNQTKSTVEKYLLNQKDLVILEVDENLLDNLSWERSRDGLFFPHLYSFLNISSVKAIYDLPIQKDGSYKFPNGF